MFSRRWLFTTLLVVVALAVTVCLGIWQLDRAQASQAAENHLLAMQKAPLLVLDEAALSMDLTGMEYRQVTANGTYDFDHQVALRNQYWGDSDGPAEYGFHLFTPLVLNSGQAVMVDRGWIPSEYNTPDSWSKFNEPNTSEVTGIIRVPVLKGEMGSGVPNPAPIPGQPLSLWNYIDLERIQTQISRQLLPIYIEQAPVGDPVALPYRSLPTIVLDDVPHMGYALMWAFFACLLLFGYPVYLRGHISS
ncbi:MAG: SURF1 family protein [Anaerolineales bacterium]